MAYNWTIYQGDVPISSTTTDVRQIRYTFPENQSDHDIVYTVKVNDGEVCSDSIQFTVKKCEPSVEVLEVRYNNGGECFDFIQTGLTPSAQIMGYIGSEGNDPGGTKGYIISGICTVDGVYSEPIVVLPHVPSAMFIFSYGWRRNGQWVENMVFHDDNAEVGNFAIEVRYNGIYPEESVYPMGYMDVTFLPSIGSSTSGVATVSACSEITAIVEYWIGDKNIVESGYCCYNEEWIVSPKDFSAVGVCVGLVNNRNERYALGKDATISLTNTNVTNGSFSSIVDEPGCACNDGSTEWENANIQITLEAGQNSASGLLYANTITRICTAEGTPPGCRYTTPGVLWDPNLFSFDKVWISIDSISHRYKVEIRRGLCVHN